MIGIRKYGLTIKVKISDPNIIRIVCNASNRAFGSAASTMPKSLENKFNMRPDGFVSKKRNDVDIIPVNKTLCSLRDARIHIV